MVDFDVFWIAAASGAVNLLCLLAVAGLWRRLSRTQESAHQKQQYLEQQIGVATSGAMGMGQRLVALERKLQALQDRQDNLTGADTFAYSQALQMFEQGADVATVASNCGFSNSEAQLMALVQKQAKISGPSDAGPAPARTKTGRSPSQNSRTTA